MEKILMTLCDKDTLEYHVITDGKTVWRKYPDGTTAACESEDFQALTCFGLWHTDNIQ